MMVPFATPFSQSNAAVEQVGSGIQQTQEDSQGSHLLVYEFREIITMTTLFSPHLLRL